jgi:hypothetical protein
MAGERSYASQGANLADLEVAWKDRLEDAEQLRVAGRYSTAITMGLYAIEILLKVKICQKLELLWLPKPLEIHDLDGLMVMSGLSARLARERRRRVRANWDKLREMGKSLNDLRYRPAAVKNHQDSEDFFAYLTNPTNGCFRGSRARIESRDPQVAGFSASVRRDSRMEARELPDLDDRQ